MKNKALLIFDNDGVLRDESLSYQRCIKETVAFFSGSEATESELLQSMKQSNSDWERVRIILNQREIKADFDKIKEKFQELYLGKKLDFTGYITQESWLADNNRLMALSDRSQMAIVSGAPKEEIFYTLKKNNAAEFFEIVLGMNDCEGKYDGIKKVLNKILPNQCFFCDDRPSSIESAKRISNLRVFGILPPNYNMSWEKTLLDAGAEKVFKNVNEYCDYLINEIK
jgi:HAD superfamily phosphatase